MGDSFRLEIAIASPGFAPLFWVRSPQKYWEKLGTIGSIGPQTVWPPGPVVQGPTVRGPICLEPFYSVWWRWKCFLQPCPENWWILKQTYYKFFSGKCVHSLQEPLILCDVIVIPEDWYKIWKISQHWTALIQKQACKLSPIWNYEWPTHWLTDRGRC